MGIFDKLFGKKEKEQVVSGKIIKKTDVKQLLEEKDVDSLIEVLRRGGTRGMQMDAAVALGELEDVKAIDPLIEALKNEFLWPDIRVYAAQSLGMIGGKRAREALKEATKCHEESVREAAENSPRIFNL